MYLAIVVDRATASPVFMASSQGGMDIEEVAAKNPKAILKEAIDPAVGFQAFQARKLAFGLGLPPAALAKAVPFMQSLYKAFEGVDASLLEINPFLMTKDGDAATRSTPRSTSTTTRSTAIPSSRSCATSTKRTRWRSRPRKFGLNYIKLEGGNVGCMVNGAGLAMATMDIIKLAGRRARELPRRGRRRERGADPQRLPHPARRQGRAAPSSSTSSAASCAATCWRRA